MKFYEAAKYYYYPGMHEPARMLAMGMNKPHGGGGLSKTDQAIIEAACNEENALTMAETTPTTVRLPQAPDRGARR